MELVWISELRCVFRDLPHAAGPTYSYVIQVQVRNAYVFSAIHNNIRKDVSVEVFVQTIPGAFDRLNQSLKSNSV